VIAGKFVLKIADWTTNKKILMAGYACFLVSLFVPAVVGVGISGWSGAGTLLFGWMGILCGGQCAWFANPAGLTAVILLKARKLMAARVFSVIAVLLSVQAIFLREMPGGPTMLPTLITLGPAVYLWWLSLVSVLAACWLAKAE
jgi:hypothetical protein